MIDGGQQQNVEIISVISFIEQTMQPLKSFGEQLKIEPGTNFGLRGNVINLSNKAFTKETFQLLNKNLNFRPTPSIFNKNQLSKELDNIFRLIKLKAYFQDNNMYNLSTEDQLFEAKTSKNWRPDKNHYTIETYIEAT